MFDAGTVIDIFLKQVNNGPDGLALKFGGREFTYRQLDELSNQVAHYLIAEGVCAEQLIPICLSTPWDMVIGVWGILKAGGAYVPIDAEFPAERIKYMIDDTAADLVITDRYSKVFIAAAEGKTIVFADDDWIVVKSESVAPVNVKVALDNVAYVIYTSGSTGLPKGVLIEHRSIVDYLRGLFRKLPYDGCKSFALGVSFAADSVVTHLFGAVLAGGALHVFSKEDYNNTEYIHKYFATHAMDCLKAVPSHWKSLSLKGVPLMPGKVMMFGGEALYAEMIRDIIPVSSRTCVMVNHYGPTEATVGQLMHEIDETHSYGHIIPIGKTFTDAVVYILDENGDEVEAGTTGELYIGGTCVARGYLNRPELTAEKFVKNKFSKDEKARLYKTGDLARTQPDGDIEYLGRIDDQVKIRGYRIELGEIENVLQQAPGVKQCVVLAKDGSSGEKRLVGYVVCPKGFDRKAIIEHLEGKLPAYMVPQLLMNLHALPFFPNGKVDKKALPNPDASSLLANTYVAPVGRTETLLSEVWKEVLGVERAGTEDNFFELGGTSLLAQKTVAMLKERNGLKVPIVKLYQFPKINALAAFLDGKPIGKKTRKTAGNATADVAVISMSGRFPGADSIEELWDVLKNGKETITFFRDDELDASVPDSVRNSSNYVRARGIVSNVKGFDAAFFGITPKMAELMDPQQRIFLEIAWEALERAGYAGKHEATIGVFAGVRFNTYYPNNILGNPATLEDVGDLQVISLNDKDYVASRTAYTLDLKGPAINIQSACSTSLLAVAQAVQAIRSGQCEMALAGGSTINSPVNTGHMYNEGAMFSDDGHCRPFDANAKGTLFSDGAGVVLLKNMDDALRDNDNIIAVIKGVGLSNDGGGKGSFMAPSAEGQAVAIRMAIDDAGISPTDISYIEAHGTATPLGDPIEIEGLNIAFGAQERKQYCALGSVKGNFGHLTTSAGIAGFIKTCLALHYKQIPPSINYSKPNPHIDFASSPFFVNAELNNWDPEGKRIAGVSSFGVGGTNVHIVMEEGNSRPVQSGESRDGQLICWSAKNEKSLDAYGDKLVRHFAHNENVNLADVAFTLQTSREDFHCRRFVVATSAADFIEQSANKALFNANTKSLREKPQNIVFMFPGQGDQYVNMCKRLYETERVFRDAMDECAEILKLHLQENILDVIYPKEVNSVTEEKIKNTAYSQPALFSIGYALGKLWISWGIYPSAFVGHSIGEFVSAYFAGVFSLETALTLIAARGRMMGNLPGGSMLSVRLSRTEIHPYLSAELALAAANSPQLSVVAGSYDAIGRLSNTLNEKGVLNRVLATSHAFHSHMMDAVVAPFEEVVKGVKLSEPLVPIMSTVTGEWLKAEEAKDPGYWGRHLRATVLFGDAVQKLLDEQYNMFLELGPGKSVSTLARQQATGKSVVVISSLEKNEVEQPSDVSILKALGQVWMNGLTPNWKIFYQGEGRVRIHDLPTYAFDRQDYWIEPLAKTGAIASRPLVVEGIQSKSSDSSFGQALIDRVKESLENISGIDMTGGMPDMTFIEIGLDSLLLTQVALMLRKKFRVEITFRQLNEELGTLSLLTQYLEANVSAEGRMITSVDVRQPKQVHPVTSGLTKEDEADIKKPFGAAARIEKHSVSLSEAQQKYLDDLIVRYNKKTMGSKLYTQQHRAYMADPRVVSGFRPATKELVYSLVMNRSKGSRMWDVDGNEYIDALNGFGSNMLGYQPDFLKNALIAQIEKGYEIGPQHELAGEVCRLICEFTDFDRSALCNTGSEAVLGAMRVARTVTGRSIIVAFAGSYHGINDEVVVRGGKKLRSYPAAPGIMPEAVQNMLILEYGTDESLRIIEERASEIAAVLVEPIQSRRCDFQPIGFLRKLRGITKAANAVLIFDEVISGFRFHPGGAQALFGVKADMGTYGKVVGGGLSIGIIAGARQYMDALDGGWWQYGDDSLPEAGVTYFAGTFVRHPLALAAAKASLDHLKKAGPGLQEQLNANGLYVAGTLNAICRRLEVPMFIVQFGSLWRIRFLEEYPYFELFFVLMRYKGIHIQEGFPCFITASHSSGDLQRIISCFEESLVELKEAGLVPTYIHPPADENKNLNMPPAAGAKLGKDKDGNPAWFIADEKVPGKYLQVISSN